MADLATVTRLLERWRDAGTLQRLTVAVDATREIRGLSPEHKRALAIEVAERVAPQLVPQIRAEQGDLTPEQVTAVVDLLRRADRDQIDGLVDALRSGDVEPALALADGALGALAPSAPPPPSEDGEDDGDPAATAAAASRPPAPARPDGRLDERLAVLDAVPDEADLREEAEERAEATRDRWRNSSPAPAAMAPLDLDFSTSFVLSAEELPDTDVDVVPTLLERDDVPPTGDVPSTDDLVPDVDGGALAAVPVTTEAVDEPRRPPLRAGRRVAAEEPGVLDVVLAAPDGYRRRRAAVAAIRDGRLRAPGTLQAVVARLARTTDRAWVAGAALDAAVIDRGDLADLDLAEGARRRLRARTG